MYGGVLSPRATARYSKNEDVEVDRESNVEFKMPDIKQSSRANSRHVETQPVT